MRSIFTILRRLQQDRRGTIAVVFALSIVPLIGFVGVSIDYARLVHMKTTLQAAADAAAISGAAANFGTPTQEATPDDPKDVATNYFTNAWLPPDLSTNYKVNAVQQTQTINSIVTNSGVTVTVSSTAQVASSFLAIWRSQIPVSVSATATAAVPGAATGAFPFIIQQCIFTGSYPSATGSYWNSSTGEPNIDPSTGKPYEITFASAYSSSGDPCLYGEFSSFTVTPPSDNAVTQIENNGCGCTLSINEVIQIDSGAQASLYGNACNVYCTGGGGADAGQIILIPIVKTQDLSLGGTAIITGFAPFILDSTNQGQKTLTGHLVSNFHGGGLSGSGGQYFGSDVVTLTN